MARCVLCRACLMCVARAGEEGSHEACARQWATQEQAGVAMWSRCCLKVLWCIPRLEVDPERGVGERCGWLGLGMLGGRE